MAIVMRLITGGTDDSPPRSPTSTTLDLSELAGGRVFLPWDGPAPGAVSRDIMWNSKRWGHDGQRRLRSRLNNAEFPILVNMQGGGYTDLETIRAEIVSFLEQAGLYEERRIGEPVWLEHRWSPDALKDKSAPVLGQWSRYWRVLDGQIPQWPRDTHSAGLVGGGFSVSKTAVNLICSPTAYGLQSKFFNADGVPGIDSDISLQQTLSAGEFSGDYTLTAWTKTLNDTVYLFEYHINSSNGVAVLYDPFAKRVVLEYKISSSIPSNVPSQNTYEHGENLHVVVSQNSTTGACKVFINGVEEISRSSHAWADTGTLTLGGWYSYRPTLNRYVDDLDGVRLFDQSWNEADALALYNDERSAKSSGAYIGQVNYHKTLNGDGKHNNVDGTLGGVQKDNWGVIGNVPGDVPSPLKLEITLDSPFNPGTNFGFWIGINPVREIYTPSDFQWVEYDGISDSVYSDTSDDQYYGGSASTADGSVINALTDSDIIALMRGQWTMLVRARMISNDADFQPVWWFKNNKTSVEFDRKTQPSNASAILDIIDLGPVVFDWRNSTPNRLNYGFNIYRGGLSSSIHIDWLLLLRDAVRLVLVGAENISTTGGSYIVSVGNREALVLDASVGAADPERTMSYTGGDLMAYPGKYNYIHTVFGRDGMESYAVFDRTVEAWITPRYLSSGGPVA